MIQIFGVRHDDPSLQNVWMLVKGIFSCAPWRSLVGRVSILLALVDGYGMLLLIIGCGSWLA
jgi:hypothetical protein